MAQVTDNSLEMTIPYPVQQYSEPYFLYEKENADDADEEQEVGIACPVCGDPSDYCLDHHHWLCDVHEDIALEINTSENDPFWQCPECPDNDIEIQTPIFN